MYRLQIKGERTHCALPLHHVQALPSRRRRPKTERFRHCLLANPKVLVRLPREVCTCLLILNVRRDRERRQCKHVIKPKPKGTLQYHCERTRMHNGRVWFPAKNKKELGFGLRLDD